MRREGVGEPSAFPNRRKERESEDTEGGKCSRAFVRKSLLSLMGVQSRGCLLEGSHSSPVSCQPAMPARCECCATGEAWSRWLPCTLRRSRRSPPLCSLQHQPLQGELSYALPQPLLLLFLFGNHEVSLPQSYKFQMKLQNPQVGHQPQHP